MPKETVHLEKIPVPLPYCPHCKANPFKPFARGQVHRSAMAHPLSWLKARLLGRPWPYCAVICGECHETVGYEVVPNE